MRIRTRKRGSEGIFFYSTPSALSAPGEMVVRIIFLALAIIFVGGVNKAYAICVDGEVDTCFLEGKQGTRTCVNGFFGPCQVPQTPSPSGTISPKYKVLTIVYSPPGTQGGGSSSSVTYGSGSSMGSTTSAGGSFKQGYKVSVTAKGGVLGTSGELGASFGYARNSQKSDSLDIKKAAATEINHRGPAIDGIDHNRDQIWLLLNPAVKLTLRPKAAEWTLDSDQVADIQYVYVGHLKDPSQMPPGVAQRLQAFGITSEDFPEILGANPFSNGTPMIDPDRFKSLHTTFPYEPPYAEGDPVPTFRFNATYSDTETASSSTTNEYSVGASATGSTDFISLFKTSVKAESSWTWTDNETSSSSAGATETASVTVGGPSFGYTGSTDIAVYYDAIYKTFVFSPIETTLKPSLRGSVKSSSGRPVIGKEVIVVSNGVKQRTFTNARGEYRVYGKISTPARLQVDRVRKQLSQPELQKQVDIVLPRTRPAADGPLNDRIRERSVDPRN